MSKHISTICAILTTQTPYGKADLRPWTPLLGSTASSYFWNCLYVASNLLIHSKYRTNYGQPICAIAHVNINNWHCAAAGWPKNGGGYNIGGNKDLLPMQLFLNLSFQPIIHWRTKFTSGKFQHLTDIRNI